MLVRNVQDPRSRHFEAALSLILLKLTEAFASWCLGTTQLPDCFQHWNVYMYAKPRKQLSFSLWGTASTLKAGEAKVRHLKPSLLRHSD